MQYEGNIQKMRTEIANPVGYFLPIGENEIEMNSLIGNKIQMNFSGQINCISCGKRTKTSFHQGFCYNCLQTAPEASESIIRPELSKSHLGIARDIEWAKKHDLVDHIVYLAVSSEVKVGVTRNNQIPTRWIDQGASFAIKLATTPNRHIAGVIEVFLKKYFTDKTNWRAMLKNEISRNTNLLEEKEKVIQLLPSELQKYLDPDNQITKIDYPVLQFPQKIKSIGFDKLPIIEGILKGIKGQYLIFNNEMVLNIRKHNGYFLNINL
ncbi:MAG: DUF2797 domain-containing protein [Prolixibacteraceae bacterium]|jgi:hypothetical protein|nr:DUF2797 domain-containing protein [Prolixibacteraceae bacterium]MBT6004519.1 DUF2797 domain-containing protein [Prolixibacteraceae bacterium]MBT7000536.1 DUF2797 domain-containing protein [Prolixibacteraceae bacterium]MBT7393484.1 DUF2797 domain-containing protein [Prolixibacteraceae bacterium]